VIRPRRAGHGLLRGLVGLLPHAALAQPAAGSPPGDGCRVVIDYRDSGVGDFPAGWQPRDDAARATYRVAAEGGLRFVRATAEGTGSQMGREFPWDAGAEPILTWRWRPRAFPTGSDERDAGRYDSTLAVYAVFGSSQLYTRAVKYIWSRVVPVGTTLRTGRAPAIVLRSGPPPDEGWVTEATHVRRDYERLYDEAPAQARGVAVLTDADQTGSRAVGDYRLRGVPRLPRPAEVASRRRPGGDRVRRPALAAGRRDRAGPARPWPSPGASGPSGPSSRSAGSAACSRRRGSGRGARSPPSGSR
jgi:hypothetical protein